MKPLTGEVRKRIGQGFGFVVYNSDMLATQYRFGLAGREIAGMLKKTR